MAAEWQARSIQRLMITVCVLIVLCQRCEAQATLTQENPQASSTLENPQAPSSSREILHYEEGGSSRQEQGQPGHSVTGQWSWVDANGQSHRIWYIADEFGFQAFGDLVPPQNPGETAPAVGATVLKGSKVEEDKGPGDPLLSPNEAALPSASSTGTRVGGDSQQGRIRIEDTASAHTSRSNVNSLNGAIIFQDKNSDPVVDLIRDRSRSDRTKPMQRTRIEDPVPSVKKQSSQAVQTRNRGRAKFMNTDVTPSPVSLSVGVNKPIPVNNAAENKNKLVDEPAEKPDGNAGITKKAKMISGDIAGNIQDLFHADLPNPIDGTRFVLIDRLQPPTMPKSRAEPTRIMPRLVPNRGPVGKFSGVHTSSISKSLALDFLDRSTTLGPHLTRGKAVGRNSIVPQPLKVEGNLNLDNFFSPISIARTTPAPFELTSLDDYYYDYYDYPESLLSNSTEPGTQSESTNSSVSSAADSAAAKPSLISMSTATANGVLDSPTKSNAIASSSLAKSSSSTLTARPLPSLPVVPQRIGSSSQPSPSGQTIPPSPKSTNLPVPSSRPPSSQPPTVSSLTPQTSMPLSRGISLPPPPRIIFPPLLFHSSPTSSTPSSSSSPSSSSRAGSRSRGSSSSLEHRSREDCLDEEEDDEEFDDSRESADERDD